MGVERWTWITCFIFLAILQPVTAQNFGQCMNDVRGGLYGLQGLLDNTGSPVQSVSNATAISYDLCVSACGAEPAAFSWPLFSQRFGAWLLPWLSLISQIPYGSEDHIDNMQAMILTVGSPALAAYSLALTTLNGRWIARRFLPSKEHPNAFHIVRVLSSLQQAPIKIEANPHRLEELLGSSDNQKWWEELTSWLHLEHSWTLAAAVSIAWVIVSYVATVVDSFTSEVGTNYTSNGQAVGTIFLWLLPIVIGWLQLSPKCEAKHIRAALHRANEHAIQAQGTACNSPAITLIPMHNELRRDEGRSPPIFNYARLFSWTQIVETAADSLQGLPTEGRALEMRREATKVEGSPTTSRDAGIRWGSGVWTRMLVSSCFALFLQWGTTGAAVIVTWFTPTVGLGCRSASYIFYAGISTLIWIMLLISSIFSQIASSPSPSSSTISRTLAALSILLRRLGKIAAAANAVGLVAICVFQFSNIFQNCFCNSTALWHGVRRAFVVLIPDNDSIVTMRTGWIGGEIMGASVALAFVVFVRLLVNPSFPKKGDSQ